MAITYIPSERSNATSTMLDIAKMMMSERARAKALELEDKRRKEVMQAMGMEQARRMQVEETKAMLTAKYREDMLKQAQAQTAISARQAKCRELSSMKSIVDSAHAGMKEGESETADILELRKMVTAQTMELMGASPDDVTAAILKMSAYTKPKKDEEDMTARQKYLFQYAVGDLLELYPERTDDILTSVLKEGKIPELGAPKIKSKVDWTNAQKEDAKALQMMLREGMIGLEDFLSGRKSIERGEGIPEDIKTKEAGPRTMSAAEVIVQDQLLRAQGVKPKERLRAMARARGITGERLLIDVNPGFGRDLRYLTYEEAKKLKESKKESWNFKVDLSLFPEHTKADEEEEEETITSSGGFKH